MAARAAGATSAATSRWRRSTSCAAWSAIDRRVSDDELWEVLGAFGPLLETQLAGATPPTLRDSGLVDAQRELRRTAVGHVRGAPRGRRQARLGPRPRLLRRTPSRSRSRSPPSTSTPPSDELAAIERFRGMLLGAIEAMERTRQPVAGRHHRRGHRDREGVAGRPRTRRPARSTSCSPSSTRSWASTGVKHEVKLVTNLLRVQRIREERGLPDDGPEPPPDLHGQPRHREDHRRPAARPDLPHPRRRRARPPRGDRPGRPGGGLRRPDRAARARPLRRGRPGRAAHRRGVLAGPRRRARLRARGDRRHREAHRGPPRPDRGRDGRLPGRDGGADHARTRACARGSRR